MSDLPQHLEVTEIRNWKESMKDPSEYTLIKKKRTFHKSLISEAKKHEGYCILRIARQEGTNETITVTEPYEEIARKLCQNSQES